MLNPFLLCLGQAVNKLIGRERQVRIILNGIVAEFPQSFSLVGLKGIGKSSILTYLHNKRRNLKIHNEEQLLTVYIDCASALAGVSFSEWILTQVQMSENTSTYVEKANAEISARNSRAILQHTFKLIRKDNIRIALLLDHVDILFKGISADEAVNLRPFVTLVSFIFASELPLFEINAPAAASWLSGVNTQVYIDPLDGNEARDLIQYAWGQANVEPLTHDELQRYCEILSLTGYYPYFILKGAAELFEMSQTQKRKSLEILVEHLYSKFKGDFLHYWRHIDRSLRKSLYQMIKNSPDFDQSDQKNLYRLWDYGLIVSVDDQRGYAPFSELWAKFVLEQIEHNQAQGTIQQKLLDYFHLRQGQICSVEHILEEVWGLSVSLQNSSKLHRAVEELREASNGTYEIISVRKQGYKYQLIDVKFHGLSLEAKRQIKHKLRENIFNGFNMSEFQGLCFDLDINDEVLPGETLDDKTRELIGYCERHGLIKNLTEKCAELRPRMHWPIVES